MPVLLQKLMDGDLRTIGRTPEVIQEVLENEFFFEEVFNGIYHEVAIIRMRSAYAIEKLARKKAHLFTKKYQHKIKTNFEEDPSEVRMYTTLLLGYSDFKEKELSEVIELLLKRLDTEKKTFVRVNCLQALADLALKNSELIPEIQLVIEDKMQTGSASIQARGRILLKKLKRK